jgi:hypothetical protein
MDVANQVKKNGRENSRSANMNCVNSDEATHNTQTSRSRKEPAACLESDSNIQIINSQMMKEEYYTPLWNMGDPNKVGWGSDKCGVVIEGSARSAQP